MFVKLLFLLSLKFIAKDVLLKNGALMGLSIILSLMTQLFIVRKFIRYKADVVVQLKPRLVHKLKNVIYVPPIDLSDIEALKEPKLINMIKPNTEPSKLINTYRI